jgi:hypothetical protein
LAEFFSVNVIGDDRASTGQFIAPLLDPIWRTMERGSDDPLGAEKVRVTPNIDNDWRGLGAEPLVQVVR